MMPLHVSSSADERFDPTFHTNILVAPSGNCTYIPPGKIRRCAFQVNTLKNVRVTYLMKLGLSHCF